MRSLHWLAIFSIAVALAGCARNKKPAAQSPAYLGAISPSMTNTAAGDQKLIITPMNGLNGKVSSINANLRFVVITFPVGQMAAINQHLMIYRDGLKVGEVNVTGPQRDDSIVADIVTGGAQTGDEVRDR